MTASSPAAKAATLGGIAILLLPVLLGAAAIGVLGGEPDSVPPSDVAIADIPTDYLALYQHSAQMCPGLDWTILAAIGKIESDHGRSTLPGVTSGANPYDARGPMQIIGPTWRGIRARHPEIGPNVYDPTDAIPAATLLLCTTGARQGRDLEGAIWHYNHADWYVRDVLHQAAEYGGVPVPNRPRGGLRLDWPREQATMPDPTSDGRITPRTYALVRDLIDNGAASGGITCFGHRANPASDHPKGRACDIFFDPHDPEDVARGWRAVNWLIEHQAQYGIHYIIYQGRFWSAYDPQWVSYRSTVYGCPNPAELTGCHYDHAHVSGLY